MTAPVLAFVSSQFLNGVITHLWESSVVGFLILGLSALCYRAPATLKKTLGWIGLIKFAIPAVLFAPALKLISDFAGRLTDQSRPLGMARTYQLMSSAVRSHTYFSYPIAYGVLGVWLAVTVFLLVRLTTGWARFRREITAACAAPTEFLSTRIETAAKTVGIDPAKVMAVTSTDDGPGVLGIRSPLVLVPSRLESLLSPAELDSILIHELIHLRRRDNLWSAIRSIFLAVFWTNPIAWLLCRQIARETERACDEEVIRLTGKPETYGSGILKTVRNSLGLINPGLSGVAGFPLTSRLREIMHPKTKIKSPAMKFVVLSAACLSFLLSSYADIPATPMPALPDLTADVQVFDIAQLDQAPRAKYQARPAYPFDLRKAHITGSALIDFVVDTNGRVRNAMVAKATAPDFGVSAQTAVEKWVFAPGKKAGEAVNTHMQVPIVFQINHSQ